MSAASEMHLAIQEEREMNDFSQAWRAAALAQPDPYGPGGAHFPPSESRPRVVPPPTGERPTPGVMPSTVEDIDPIDDLMQQIADGEEDWADGFAMYDGRTAATWEHLRKIVLSEVRETIRQQFAARGEKVTDGRVDDMAHAHPEYKAFVEKHAEEKKAWGLREAQNRRAYMALKLIEADAWQRKRAGA